MHNESHDSKAPEQGSQKQDDQKHPDTQKSAPPNPDELPDGSGTDAHGHGSEQGQETGEKSFDAG